MPGALIHIIIGLISAVVVYIIIRKLEFSLAIFIGNLLPDIFKLSYLAFYYKSLNLKLLVASHLHLPVHLVVNGGEFIIFFFAFFFALSWLLYHFHFIKKRKLEEYDRVILYLVIGYIIHIIIDLIIPRTGIWI